MTDRGKVLKRILATALVAIMLDLHVNVVRYLKSPIVSYGSLKYAFNFIFLYHFVKFISEVKFIQCIPKKCKQF